MNTPGGFYLRKTLLDAVAETGAGAESLLLTGDAVGGLEMVACQVTGTFTATVTFQATVDGAVWVDVDMTPVGATDTPATTTTAAGIFRANLKGCTRFRCNVTAYTDGNVSAIAQAVA